jgi:hypothetical protein
MSKLTTTTSTTHPSNPSTGLLLYETDTNRIIFWDGSVYRIFNSDTVSSPTGGADDIHYPSGLFTNTNANYYISTTPQFHFDANYLDGVNITTGSDGDVAIPTNSFGWRDRTNANYKTYNATNGTCNLKTNISGTLSDGKCTMPAIANQSGLALQLNYAPETGFPANPGTEFTMFSIQCGAGQANITPFGNYTQFYQDGGATHMFAGISASMTNHAQSLSIGPNLRIGRSGSGGTEYWDTAIGGNTGETGGVVTVAPAYNTLIHTYAMYTWEIIMFSSALSYADINTVKDYLQNKYTGLSESLPDSGSTPALTTIL